MIRDLKVDEQLVFNKNKAAVVFHIPEHCAGCKRAISILEEYDLDNWDIVLINAEDEAFRKYIEQYEATTAPTVIVFNEGKQVLAMRNLKEFMEKKSIFKE